MSEGDVETVLECAYGQPLPSHQRKGLRTMSVRLTEQQRGTVERYLELARTIARHLHRNNYWISRQIARLARSIAVIS